MNDLAPQIEAFLLAAGGWVPAGVLCAQFNVGERALRCVERKPGLVSEFAISGDKGLKHVENATKAEWLRFKARILYHATGELRRLRRLAARRNALQRQRGSVVTEKDSDQILFSLS